MRQRILALCLAVLICSTTITNTISALTNESFYDENFYSLNNIGWYDPRCAEATSAQYVQLAGNDNTEKILNFFMRKGLTLAQAAGFVGNMMQESGLDPAKEQGGKVVDNDYTLRSNVGFGLVQWTDPGRQRNFTKFMRELGVPVTDLSGQLEFTWKELNDSYAHVLSALKQTEKPDVAAVIIHGRADTDSSHPTYREGMRLMNNKRGYEASGDTGDAVVQKRGSTASVTYTKYVDAPALAGATADSSMLPAGEGSDHDISALRSTDDNEKRTCIGQAGGGAGGAFSDLVLKYAWQDFINPGSNKTIDGKTITATTQRPDYTMAIANAKRESRYIGGANGNDCGGFVTTLIYDSGHDKSYNSAKGNTSTQETWLRKNWQRLNPEDEKDPAKRQPGDVAINEDHTYVYVGDIPGFNSKIASASWDDRAPMAGSEGVVDSSFRWYRKK